MQSARPRRPSVALAAAALVLLLGTARPAGSAVVRQDPTIAPETVLSPDGRTATDGTRTLAVSQALDLDPAGQTITVTGSGYDVAKGVYVAVCAIPPRNAVPTPCGGGVDTAGEAGASQWVSSDPPSYGVGLAQPYGPGGTFTATFSVQPVIAGGIDCRVVRCAVVTRADHTRTADRSQDIFVPVTFRAPATATPGGPPSPNPSSPNPATPGPSTTAPPATAPSTTTTSTTAPPPTTTVLEAGRAVTDGARTLRVSVARIEGDDAEIDVRGEGYDEGSGVLVGLCALGDGGAAPGPCASGSPEVSAWISSDPPDYGVDLATPYGTGGTFSTTLRVSPRIDAGTDCREVACAIVTRPDAEAPDRSQEMVLPVEFVAAADPDPRDEAVEGRVADEAAEGELAAGSPTSSPGSGGGSPLGWVGVVVVVAAGAAGAVMVRRRGRGEAVVS